MPELTINFLSAIAKHTAAFFYAKPIDILNKGSAESIQRNQGTITFINYRGLCLGITNEHVVEDYDGPGKDRVYYIALNKHETLPGRLLFKSTQDKPDFSFDIAIFLLDQDTILKGGKIPIELDKCYGELKKDDIGLAVGFPGVERRRKDSMHMAHGIYHVLAKCVNSPDRMIILQEKLAPPTDRIIRFGGMSGGPIFHFISEDNYNFSGIMFEGRGFHEEENASPGEDIWIYGFPLGPEQLDSAFKLFKPDTKLQRLNICTKIKLK
jgi:hypothetical protein